MIKLYNIGDVVTKEIRWVAPIQPKMLFLYFNINNPADRKNNTLQYYQSQKLKGLPLVTSDKNIYTDNRNKSEAHFFSNFGVGVQLEEDSITKIAVNSYWGLRHKLILNGIAVCNDGFGKLGHPLDLQISNIVEFFFPNQPIVTAGGTFPPQPGWEAVSGDFSGTGTSTVYTGVNQVDITIKDKTVLNTIKNIYSGVYLIQQLSGSMYATSGVSGLPTSMAYTSMVPGPLPGLIGEGGHYIGVIKKGKLLNYPTIYGPIFPSAGTIGWNNGELGPFDWNVSDPVGFQHVLGLVVSISILLLPDQY